MYTYVHSYVTNIYLALLILCHRVGASLFSLCRPCGCSALHRLLELCSCSPSSSPMLPALLMHPVCRLLLPLFLSRFPPSMLPPPFQPPHPPCSQDMSSLRTCFKTMASSANMCGNIVLCVWFSHVCFVSCLVHGSCSPHTASRRPRQAGTRGKQPLEALLLRPNS